MHEIKKMKLSLCILETVRDRPIVSMEHYNRKSMVADRPVSVPVTLCDLERWDAKGQTLPEDVSNYAPTVWSITSIFAKLVGRSLSLGGQIQPFLMGGAAASISFLAAWETATKLCIVIKQLGVR